MTTCQPVSTVCKIYVYIQSIIFCNKITFKTKSERAHIVFDSLFIEDFFVNSHSIIFGFFTVGYFFLMIFCYDCHIKVFRLYIMAHLLILLDTGSLLCFYFEMKYYIYTGRGTVQDKAVAKNRVNFFG